MSKRIHYYSWTLDRAFTFDEWCDYLKYNDSTGTVVFTFRGFGFNTHGVCLNPNVLRIEKKVCGMYCYYDLRTFLTPRPPILPGKPRTGAVWNFSLFGTNCGARGNGYVEGGEQLAIISGLRAAERSITKQIDWYKEAIEARAGYEEENEGESSSMGYGVSIKRCRDILELTKREIQRQGEPTLF